MADPIYEGFGALLGITDDDILKSRLEKQIENLFAEKRKEKDYAEAYLYIEHELVTHSNGRLSESDVRNRVKRAFAGAEKDYPGFSHLFLSDERQYLRLVNELIAAYADEWRLLFGSRATETALSHAFRGTPWEKMKVSVEKGLAFDPVRMRSVGECGEIAFALFGAWHAAALLMFGRKAASRSFERAYRNVITRRAFLPVVPKLLGAMPLDVLADEKAKRIRELETTTSTQARSIRAADEDLRRQSERLEQTVGELGETKERLIQTSKARSEFITVVSHQFRTPLSTIRWNSELLTDAVTEGKIDGEYGEPIDNVRSKSVYLSDTLDRVFTTLDIDTGELNLDLKEHFLWEVVQDVYRQYEKQIEREGLKWKFKRRKTQLKEIPMDRDKISKVLRILISNAIYYNKEKGTITADVDTEERNGKTYHVFRISDTGIGIPKDDQEKVFEKFFRSKPSVLKVADGTGLGMYVVKHIIEAHQGEVAVESEGKDKGTTVTFSLPVERK